MSETSKLFKARALSHEIRLLILCSVRAYLRGDKRFQVKYKEKLIENFNNVIFFDGKSEKYQLIQLKHKEDNSKITGKNLFSDDVHAEFNLLNYVHSIVKINLQKKFKENLKFAVVFTNIDLELIENQLTLSNKWSWFGEIKSIQVTPLPLEADAIFSNSENDEETSYKDKCYMFNGDEKIVEILQSQEAQLFKDMETLTENQIRDALKKIVFAVNQPDHKELISKIKDEIKNHFNLSDIEAKYTYNAFEITIRDWCEFGLCLPGQDNPEVIDFKVIDTIFQQNTKQIIFDVVPPVKSFVGRERELEKMRITLEQEQCLCVTGLPGVGKTELVRKFIDLYGESDFYERIIWINAANYVTIEEANYVTIEESFKRFLAKLNPNEPYTFIDSFFNFLNDFFKGLKVLFVFDNFNQGHIDKFENDALNCYQAACAAKNLKIICISNDATLLPDSSSDPLILDVWSKNDAEKFVRREFETLNSEVIEKFVETLKCVPFAFQKAINLIKAKQENTSYSVENFLEDFKTKESEFNDIRLLLHQYTQVSFNVKSPKISKNLLTIREELKRNHSISITGTDVSKKIELSRQFIKEFGESDFYGRVIWLETENEETLKESFKELALHLKISIMDDIIVVIDKVFKYFQGLKALFVLNNFNYNNDQTQNIILHYLKRSTDSNKEFNLHFLFVSSSASDLKNVSSLNLDIVSKENVQNQFKMAAIERKYASSESGYSSATSTDYSAASTKQYTDYFKPPYSPTIHETSSMYSETAEYGDFFKSSDTQKTIKSSEVPIKLSEAISKPSIIPTTSYDALPKFFGGTSGARGVTYEARLCMLTFLRGYTLGLKNFKLYYKVPDAGKFGTIVFDEGGERYSLFQLKHKENMNKISHSQLFNEKFNTDLNLIRYVKSIVDANANPKFRGKIKTAVVVTNIDFDLKNKYEFNLTTNLRPSQNQWYRGLKSIELYPLKQLRNEILDCSMYFQDAKYYKFNDSPNIIEILKRQAVTLARDVGVLTEDEIRDALQYIVYAVFQPNDMELKEMIKTEIKDHFKLQSTDAIYNELEVQFRTWCDTKCAFEQSSASMPSNLQQQEVLTYNDANQFFQKNVKKISFGVTAPISSFTGRTDELDRIRKKLEENKNLIVSQSALISGLGGIGKTQLTKQFIKEFGQSEFYGRVMWIEAESDESVANSFRQIAQRINIENVQNKDTKVVIDEVLQYFEGFKVLFVFDNFDKNAVNDGNLVSYCRKSASNSEMISRPFFLFISRNRRILPGVPQLNLDVLSADDAVQLIERELKEICPTREDAQTLAKLLQYFPLAIQQAIAFSKEQQYKSKFFGRTYEIHVYFEKFKKEIQELLNYEYPDEFGEYEKTTFITWNVTLDAIQSDKINGKNATKVLQHMAYLYADKIGSKIFLSLFDDDREKTANAILLLEKYSMITKVSEENESIYQIHRLVQAVIQLKFKKNEKDNINEAMVLIHPELYKKYLNDKTKNESLVMMRNCTIDQVMHYKSLKLYIEKHKNMSKKYKNFFEDLQNNVLLNAVFSDDIEKIEALNLTHEKLKMFIESHIEEIKQKQCSRVINYFREKRLIEFTDLE